MDAGDIDEDRQDSAEGAGVPVHTSNPGLRRQIPSLLVAKIFSSLFSLSSFFLTSTLPVFMLDLPGLNTYQLLSVEQKI
jgi:hypothetical protein